MQAFYFENSDLTYTLRRSKRVKSKKIVVKPNKIEVVGPNFANENSLHNFILSKQNWVFEKYKEIQKYKNSLHQVSFEGALAGKAIFYKGNEFYLKLIASTEILPKIDLDECGFKIYIPSIYNEKKQKDLAKEALKNYLKDELLKIANRKAKLYCEITGKEFKEIKIKELKSIWGSCTSKGVINLNWQLITLPKNVINYVILHEVCHLTHRNHSRKFWDLVKAIMPDYKKMEMILKQSHTGVLDF